LRKRSSPTSIHGLAEANEALNIKQQAKSDLNALFWVRVDVIKTDIGNKKNKVTHYFDMFVKNIWSIIWAFRQKVSNLVVLLLMLAIFSYPKP